MKILNLYSTATAYRGIKYDTHAEHSCEIKQVEMSYRGKRYNKPVKVCN